MSHCHYKYLLSKYILVAANNIYIYSLKFQRKMSIIKIFFSCSVKYLYYLNIPIASAIYIYMYIYYIIFFSCSNKNI